MRWILFILFCLLGAPAHAVSITRRYNHNDNGLND